MVRRGQRGRLPCVHQHWCRSFEYDDPFYQEGVKPWPQFVAAIKAGGKVVVTRDAVTEKGRVADMRVDGTHLRFRRNGLRELELM